MGGHRASPWSRCCCRCAPTRASARSSVRIPPTIDRRTAARRAGAPLGAWRVVDELRRSALLPCRGGRLVLEQIPRPWLRLRLRLDVDADALSAAARVDRAHGPIGETLAVRVPGLDEVLEVALHRLGDFA